MTHTDKKMLELAAKAANINLYWMELSGPVTVEGGRNWNPLTDDGDALRLAVTLGISVDQVRAPSFPYAYAASIEDGFEEHYSDHNDDPCAATRRAIVRAAVGIGSTMPDVLQPAN